MISRFFQFLSKTDRETVKRCSRHVQMTQSSLGVMVFFTGALAFFSGGYAIYVAMENWVSAVIVAVVYSLMIITFDREIVSSTNKRAVWARLPLALMIGFIVAVPLELRLLQGRIDEKINEQNLVKNQDARAIRQAAERDFQKRKTTLRDEINKYRQNIDEWGRAMEAEIVGRVINGRTGLPGNGPAYRAAEEQKKTNERLLERAENELARIEAAERDELKRMDEAYNRDSVRPAFDLLAKYEALETLKSESHSAMLISWGLRLLFILIEMFPALIKLFLPYNEYSAIIEARRRENIQRVHGVVNNHLGRLATDPLSDVPNLMTDLKNIQ